VNKSDLSAAPIASFERFVYADVVEERNGMTLSVLSALSRRGLDPWQEAQRLAELPPAAAIDALAHTLASLPLSLSFPDDARATSQRLVALLPSPAVASASISRPSVTPQMLAIAPRWMMLGMAVAVIAGLALPNAGNQKADTVAPASWLASGSSDAAKPATAPRHDAIAPSAVEVPEVVPASPSAPQPGH
jgi:hypothetical protein